MNNAIETYARNRCTVELCYDTDAEDPREWAGENEPEYRAEIEASQDYRDWLNGEVYGYVVTDKYGRLVESVWGFYGFDYVQAEANAVADAYTTPAPKAGTVHA